MNGPQFSIVPKSALGGIHLGSTLNAILKQARSTPHRLIYSEDAILTTPYVVQLSRFGIQLIINQSTQRLVLIEVLRPGSLELSYRGTAIRNWGIKTIYNDVFGPTYQGVVNHNCYVLSYPGISFKFDLANLKESADAENVGLMLSRLLEQDVEVSSIAIHPYKQYKEWTSELSCSLLSTSIEIEKLFIGEKKEHSDNSVIVKFLKHPQNLKQYVLELNRCNQQDVLCTLGPPDDVFHKIDNRTLIHSSSVPLHTSNSPASEEEDGLIFHNYYHYGFDLLYSNNLLMKIIIHNNSPLNRLLFGKYEKCSFEYEVTADKPLKYTLCKDKDLGRDASFIITGDTPFSEIQGLLNIKDRDPIIMNRSNRSIGHDIELIDSFDYDSWDLDTHEKNPTNGESSNVCNLEIKSLCFVDDHHGFNWDVFESSDGGVVESITIY